MICPIWLLQSTQPSVRWPRPPSSCLKNHLPISLPRKKGQRQVKRQTEDGQRQTVSTLTSTVIYSCGTSMSSRSTLFLRRTVISFNQWKLRQKWWERIYRKGANSKFIICSAKYLWQSFGNDAFVKLVAKRRFTNTTFTWSLYDHRRDKIDCGTEFKGSKMSTNEGTFPMKHGANERKFADHDYWLQSPVF